MLDETDPQALTVEVRGKIKQVRLDRSLVSAKRGVKPDIRNPRNLLFPDRHEDGVHPIGKEHVHPGA
jgi:hypothetical protein